MQTAAATTKITVATDFSRFPGGRYARFGKFSGEAFRKELLAVALRRAIAEKSVVVVKLDGAMGYLSSFLEEAFGGLVRSEGFSHDEVARHLKVVAEDERFSIYEELARRYIQDAKRA